MAGREDMVRLLKEECRDTLDMNARTQRGPASTSLHLASERGHAAGTCVHLAPPGLGERSRRVRGGATGVRGIARGGGQAVPEC